MSNNRFKVQVAFLAALLTGLILFVVVVHQKAELSVQPTHRAPEVVAHETTTFVEDVETYEIPSAKELERLSSTDQMNIYWTYINRLQVLCKDVIRVGSLKDGGKEICVDKPYKPKAPCVVYSFGINYQFDFDYATVDLFGCDVYAFDPSMNRSTSRITEHIKFYKWGLGGEDMVNNYGWPIKTLSSIRKELGHTDKPIDLLKIDIEGDEWHAIPQMIASGALDDVKQISMETHFLSERPSSPKNWGSIPLPGHLQLSALRQLYDAGYRIFMRERNMWSHQQWPSIRGFITNVNEISLIRPVKK
ncbi:uncharacterized protein LOC127858369 isoform X6 [Dreissena polymorpha]|nr:uncharacterized protein LOC127858369 isoform X6 [Dreissena polymorpha]